LQQDVDALKKRAERFGQVLSSTLTKADAVDKVNKRKERFGEISNTPSKFTKISFNGSSADEVRTLFIPPR